MSDLDGELDELLACAGTRTRLTGAEARTILGVLVGFDHLLHESFGWEIPTALHVLRGAYGPLGLIDAAHLRPAPIPDARWGEEPGAVLDTLAALCERSPTVAAEIVDEGGADRPVVALAFTCMGWQRKPGSDLTVSTQDHPEVREDEVRIIAAVDLDERIYQLMRFRHTGKSVVKVCTNQQLAYQIASSDDPHVRWMRETHPGGMPRIPRALAGILRAVAPEVTR